MLTDTQLLDIPARLRTSAVLALAQAVHDAPEEDTPHLVLRDALADAGASWLSAVRISNRVRRAARTPGRIAAAVALAVAATPFGALLRHEIRARAVLGGRRYTLAVVGGLTPPTRSGAGESHAPSGAPAAGRLPRGGRVGGMRVSPRPSTLGVAVGCEWILALQSQYQREQRWVASYPDGGDAAHPRLTRVPPAPADPAPTAPIRCIASQS